MTRTPNSATTGLEMQLMPFIYFYGRAEEALAFYKSVLGGDYTIVQRNVANDDPRLDPSFVGKISYATLTAPGISFAASDGGGPKHIDPDEGNIILSLRVPEDAQRVFAALGDGGHVIVPFGDVPWGGKFGHLRDRFQTDWFVLS
ncbi:MAG TPA: VOC family protein [Candidatus Baltobacteraceae bacterium]|nr:VOC family protein [Candidatus Baltobacteraceae bacterium]